MSDYIKERRTNPRAHLVAQLKSVEFAKELFGLCFVILVMVGGFHFSKWAIVAAGLAP